MPVAVRSINWFGCGRKQPKGIVMGKGIDAARAAGAGLHADVLDDFKDQLLIAFLRRLGSNISIPVKEVDETGRFVCSFNIVGGVFNFTLTEKQ